jgi:hypothetical protein
LHKTGKIKKQKQKTKTNSKMLYFPFLMAKLPLPYLITSLYPILPAVTYFPCPLKKKKKKKCFGWGDETGNSRQKNHSPHSDGCHADAEGGPASHAFDALPQVAPYPLVAVRTIRVVGGVGCVCDVQCLKGEGLECLAWQSAEGRSHLEILRSDLSLRETLLSLGFLTYSAQK